MNNLQMKEKLKVFTLTQDPPKYGAIRYDPEHKYSRYGECTIKGFMKKPHPAVYGGDKYIFIRFWDEEAEFMFEGEISIDLEGEKYAKLWWD